VTLTGHSTPLQWSLSWRGKHRLVVRFRSMVASFTSARSLLRRLRTCDALNRTSATYGLSSSRLITSRKGQRRTLVAGHLYLSAIMHMGTAARSTITKLVSSKDTQAGQRRTDRQNGLRWIRKSVTGVCHRYII
jgi:hypothetical protein